MSFTILMYGGFQSHRGYPQSSTKSWKIILVLKPMVRTGDTTFVKNPHEDIRTLNSKYDDMVTYDNIKYIYILSIAKCNHLG